MAFVRAMRGGMTLLRPATTAAAMTRRTPGCLAATAAAVASARAFSCSTMLHYRSSSDSSDNSDSHPHVGGDVIDAASSSGKRGLSFASTNIVHTTPSSSLRFDLLAWQAEQYRTQAPPVDQTLESASPAPVPPSTFSAILQEDEGLCRLDHRLLEQTHAIGSLHAAALMSSTLKKRRRKMKKHKHRKWLKKMKSVWASLKK
ncbi:hypothetical protein PTSG_01149 [Salpingoeca rosetta]|uniref:Ribosomal protein mS38 C-terminal domain-containing protein n=1 Tax=Salpingoeca rosetta (strain ATCC 50818 / BSB-021) TaxID=946362 RepID=F2U0Y3_SALR5|nr:uncharacterized protein PTSG_01149 [Salpingoeca rosetta]EGD80557.1 hypothetical protein PTSG_01149 [Salpingoeca rosetta]|eukprot:XP_004997118.1 hypothetical protein PTSG_01149 [Salpingoeca rosetta]